MKDLHMEDQSGAVKPSSGPDFGATNQVGQEHSPIRVLAFMEASWLTGPAKNLIEFAGRAAKPEAGSPYAVLQIATFVRGTAMQPNAFVSACRQVGLQVHVIQERFAFDPSVIPAMRKLCRKFPPDIVQTHSVKSHFLMYLSRIHRQRTWIAFHHGYTWTDFKMRLYNQLDRISLRAADHVITVCRPFAVTLRKKGVRAERISVQHNAVKMFCPLSMSQRVMLKQTLGITPETPILLAVGRLSREKGHIDLIHAVHLLRQELGAMPVLVVVGKGPELGTLQDAAKSLGVADQVKFVGHQSDPQSFYSIADIMVLPSHSEGSPNTLLEAMAAGIPTVATAVGGVSEIVSAGKTAFLVDRKAPAALAKAIAELLKDKNLRAQIGSAAQIASCDYSPYHYCSAMLAIYKRLYRPNREQTLDGAKKQMRSSSHMADAKAGD